jgi:hypothetical protein
MWGEYYRKWLVGEELEKDSDSSRNFLEET